MRIMKEKILITAGVLFIGVSVIAPVSYVYANVDSVSGTGGPLENYCLMSASGQCRIGDECCYFWGLDNGQEAKCFFYDLKSKRF